MALTISVERVNKTDARLERHAEQGAANTALTVRTPKGALRRLLYVTVRYSATPAAGTVQVKLISGAGPAWDTVIASQSAARDMVIYPGGTLEILSDDQIEVSVPAAGAGVSAAVAIYTEEVLR